MKAIRLLVSSLLAATTLAAGAAWAQECEGPAGEVRLRVQVTGVNSRAGEVAITVYPDDARRFLAPRGRLLRVRTATRQPTTEVCFNLPRAGSYAVAAYHDANGDHDFNRNALGLPTEGGGFSNDPANLFGAPAFRSVRFPVQAGDNTLRIAMRYPPRRGSRR